MCASQLLSVGGKHLGIRSSPSFADTIFLSFHLMTLPVHLGDFSSAQGQSFLTCLYVLHLHSCHSTIHVLSADNLFLSTT